VIAEAGATLVAVDGATAKSALNSSKASVKIASNGDVLTMLLLTELSGKPPIHAAEIEFFSARVDPENSVRLGRSASSSVA
jgi:hypothetical protein